jgi:hypothetical protein
MEKGFSPDEAAAGVKRAFACYGDPDGARFETGDNRPLPVVLRERVNKWIMKMMASQTKPDLGGLLTLNALIRREIRKGNI